MKALGKAGRKLFIRKLLCSDKMGHFLWNEFKRLFNALAVIEPMLFQEVTLPIEIEAKYQVDDLAEIEARIREAGGSRFLDFYQHDLIYDNVDRSLRESDSNLRVRQEKCGDKEEITICFKGAWQGGPYKKREEIELTVADLDIARQLLNALGFEIVLELEKQRRMARFQDCLVCLDEVVNLGSFVEIEGPAEEKIRYVVDVLSLQNFPSITHGYPYLLARKLVKENNT